MGSVVVSGAFGEISSRMLRFMEEASRLGPLEVLLWSDELAERFIGERPAFPVAERAYVLNALRYVTRVRIEDSLPHPDALPDDMAGGLTWVVDSASATEGRQVVCQRLGHTLEIVGYDERAGFPEREEDACDDGRKTIIVTGCYDGFHSGHVRFFEEVSELGKLYVVVGHDANLRLLKGEGHPMFPEDERRYMAQSIRFVTRALVSSGEGWMDAEPEIERLKPDAYAVNEDGDEPEKRAFCRERGMEYIVLRREPKPGLARRSSTDLKRNPEIMATSVGGIIP